MVLKSSHPPKLIVPPRNRGDFELTNYVFGVERERRQKMKNDCPLKEIGEEPLYCGECEYESYCFNPDESKRPKGFNDLMKKVRENEPKGGHLK